MSSLPGRFSRIGLYLPLIGLIVLAVLWSALWVYGRSRVAGEMDLFMAREAAAGREWSCPDRTIRGYPFRIELRCKEPTFRQVDGAEVPASGSVAGITAIATTAGALTSGHVILEFDAPFRAIRDGVFETRLSWKTARSSIRGSVNRLDRASVQVEQPDLVIRAGDSVLFSARAEALDMHLREAQGQPGGTFDLALDLKNGAVPALDALLGNSEPVTASFDSRIFGLTAINRKDWKATLDGWRDGGGVLRVERMMIGKGASRAEGKGDLRLDDLRRVTGQLDATFVNADALLRQFGVTMAESLIGALLGGGRGGRAEEPRRERVLRLPVTFSEGRIAVGPLRLPGLRLVPLY